MRKEGNHPTAFGWGLFRALILRTGTRTGNNTPGPNFYVPEIVSAWYVLRTRSRIRLTRGCSREKKNLRVCAYITASRSMKYHVILGYAWTRVRQHYAFAICTFHFSQAEWQHSWNFCTGSGVTDTWPCGEVLEHLEWQRVEYTALRTTYSDLFILNAIVSLSSKLFMVRCLGCKVGSSWYTSFYRWCNISQKWLSRSLSSVRVFSIVRASEAHQKVLRPRNGPISGT